jgi:hypothetical protein
MMELIQTILMIIGAITVIWLIYKTIKGTLWLLGAMFEAGFRNHFPSDFMMNIGWIVSELESRGYKQAEMIDAGGDNPGVIMKNSRTDIEMEIRLRAPLLSDKGYSVIVANHSNNTAIVMQNSASEDNKRLLTRFLE